MTVRAVSNLAALYWSSGKLEQAESLALRAESAFHDLPAASQADRSANRQILASIYLKQHRYADAENLLHDTLEGGDGANCRDGLQQPGRGGIGCPRQREGRRVLAAGHSKLAQRDLPARHPLTAVALNNLAQACRFQGKYLEAESYYRQAIGIWEDALGAQHPDFARGLMNLAAFYHERGREAGRRGSVHARRRDPGAVPGQAQCRSAGGAQRTGRCAARRAPLHGIGEALARHAGRDAERLPGG